MQDADIWEAYHHWYYDSGVWKTTEFLGVKVQKSVSDLWNYQEILHELKPHLLVEFGTHAGGSALFFSVILRQIVNPYHVLTVDLDHSLIPDVVKQDRDIEFMMCSSSDPMVGDRIVELRKQYSGPIFAILDSDHSKDHVLAEMKSLRGITERGDYIVVEDSNINGNPVLPDWGEGPMEAVDAYMQEYPDDYLRDVPRETRFGFTFGPGGFLIRN